MLPTSHVEFRGEMGLSKVSTSSRYTGPAPQWRISPKPSTGQGRPQQQAGDLLLGCDPHSGVVRLQNANELA